MRAAAVALLLTACFHVESPGPSVEARLAKCRAEALTAFTEAPPESANSRAMLAYESCKRRLGVSL